MGIIAKITAFVLGVSFMVFVAFFGRLPIFRRTPISFLHRLIWVHIPQGILALDQKLTSGRFSSSLLRWGRYLMNDKHPTVLIFFFLLLFVSECFALPGAWHQLTAFQQATVSVAVALPYIFLYLAAYSDPGVVTRDSHAAHMAVYPYDFTLFHPGTLCRTCNLLKPARSKHCGICKRCIGRLDHHCIFINNCVGSGNTHWFFLLLLSTAVLTLWGGLLATSLVLRPVRAHIPGFSVAWWRATDVDSSKLEFQRYVFLWAWGLHQQTALGAVGLLALLTTPLVWGLLAYNLWNVWGGVTTNESLKWSDLAEDMRDGIAFKRPLPPGRRPDPRIEPQWTRWPVDSEQILVRSTNGEPPPATEGFGSLFPGEGEWERVWKLKHVENLYDLGFWDNLLDIFAPGSVSRVPATSVSASSASEMSSSESRFRGRRGRKGRR